MKTTRYFQSEGLLKRPYLKMTWIADVIAMPLKTETQEDGRVRHWGYIAEFGRVLRVITLEDGTVHNAFPDRNFRRE